MKRVEHHKQLKNYKLLSVLLGVTVLILSLIIVFLLTKPAQAPENDNTSSPDTNQEVPNPSEPNGEDQDRVNAYIGLSEEEAISRAEQDGYTYRIVARDGERFPVTMDYNPSRVNFTIVDGIVTDAYLG
ncbi:MAG: hypothetical protein U5K77_02380 [Candidatus Saccharibacteria bacterium]|nr:hypothetical protein [Candidatus Saccharibacteria bacterium]